MSPSPQIDWEKTSYISGVLAFMGGIVAWLVNVPIRFRKKVYIKEEIDELFLRKHTGIGSRGVEIKGADELYAPIAVAERMELMLKTSVEKHEEAIEETRKWQKIAKDWVERP